MVRAAQRRHAGCVAALAAAPSAADVPNAPRATAGPTNRESIRESIFSARRKRERALIVSRGPSVIEQFGRGDLGHGAMSELSPFLGVKPTWAGRRGMSACDPMSEKLRFEVTCRIISGLR